MNITYIIISWHPPIFCRLFLKRLFWCDHRSLPFASQVVFTCIPSIIFSFLLVTLIYYLTICLSWFFTSKPLWRALQGFSSVFLFHGFHHLEERPKNSWFTSNEVISCIGLEYFFLVTIVMQFLWLIHVKLMRFWNLKIINWSSAPKYSSWLLYNFKTVHLIQCHQILFQWSIYVRFCSVPY